MDPPTGTELKFWSPTNLTYYYSIKGFLIHQGFYLREELQKSVGMAVHFCPSFLAIMWTVITKTIFIGA